MKKVLAPVCPRCNTSDDVTQITNGLVSADQSARAGTASYVLNGHCIRPDNPEWYCAVCEESFGARREFWGHPKTTLIQ